MQIPSGLIFFEPLDEYMTIRISQFSDDRSDFMIVFDIKIDRRHLLLICVYVDPPVALVDPRFCPHPQMVNFSRSQHRITDSFYNT